MTADQAITLLVLVTVVGVMIADKLRADVAALSGAAVLLMTGVVSPIEVQGAFASPAIIALASLFVIAYALELSGLLDRAIAGGVALSKRMGSHGIWLLLTMIGGVGFFLNSTPIVVMGAPVIRDVAIALKQSPKRYLIPLSYVTILSGCCTLIGTSTNLIVDDMASVAGQPRFGIFEITPVGVSIAIVGGLYLFFFSGRLLQKSLTTTEEGTTEEGAERPINLGDVPTAQVGDVSLFSKVRPLNPLKAAIALVVFAAAILLATLKVAPIAATAFSGAVVLILLRVISADEAYHGLKPQILILIAGMIVIGIATEVTGLAGEASSILIENVHGLGPLAALAVLYVSTVILTEILSNATVAVLATPVAVALAQSLGVSPRPYVVAVMMAASIAFATPFGYQTNTIVYQMGRYSYMDFVRVGLPLNIITAITAILVIPVFFPF